MTMFDRLDTACMFYLFSLKEIVQVLIMHWEKIDCSVSLCPHKGPVVQCIISLVKGLLSLLAGIKSSALIFFAEKNMKGVFAKLFTFFFSPKMAVFLHTKCLILNFNVIK